MKTTKLITIKDLSEHLGCSVQVISNWVRRGKVGYKKKYGRTLIVCDENNKPLMICKEKTDISVKKKLKAK